MFKGMFVVSAGVMLLLITEAMAVISAMALQVGDGIMVIVPIGLSFGQFFCYYRLCRLVYAKKEETS